MVRDSSVSSSQGSIWSSSDAVEELFRIGWNAFTSGLPEPIQRSPQKDGWRSARATKRSRDRALAACQYFYRDATPESVYSFRSLNVPPSDRK